MPLTPTLSTVIREAITSRLLDVHTSLVARVDSYDASTQTCECTPVVKRTISDENDEKIQEQLPKLSNVPVQWLRGGGFFCSLPLQKGDHVTLMFQESAIGQWRDSGEISDPGDLRRHGLGYPIAIPGIAPNSGKLADAGSGNAVLGLDGDDAQVHITPGGEIHLGKNASEKMARADRVVDELTAIIDGFNAHTHTVPIVGPAGTTPSTAPLAPIGAAGDPGADIVKGK